MNTQDIQHVKMAWLAAEEAGDKQAQMALLRDNPDHQDELVNFIAAYRVTGPEKAEAQQAILPVAQRAFQVALGRLFGEQAKQAVANLRELRASRGLSLVQAARGLQLGVDVWKKFEDGLIELVSLSERQLERLAHFFSVPAGQFGSLLNNSQPAFTLNRRQTAQAAQQQEQGGRKQSFAEAVEKSSMPTEDKQVWLS